jgi:outer membrane receptor protein involved in Fe transport
VNPANGQIVCHAALVNAAYANCVPLNLFGPTASSQAAFNYIRQDTRFSATYLMDDVTASLSGAPINDWAGPIDMAVSAEWRKTSYRVLSNALPTDPVNCTGIQFNCNSGTSPYFANIVADFQQTSEHVAEVAYETEVPLLADKFFVKSLSLNAAARYTDYQTSGNVWTWKVGGTWEVNDEFRLRGTRSRDIRAPGLVDLYQPATVAVTNITDIHTGPTFTRVCRARSTRSPSATPISHRRSPIPGPAVSCGSRIFSRAPACR